MNFGGNTIQSTTGAKVWVRGVSLEHGKEKIPDLPMRTLFLQAVGHRLVPAGKERRTERPFGTGRKLCRVSQGINT